MGQTPLVQSTPWLDSTMQKCKAAFLRGNLGEASNLMEQMVTAVRNDAPLVGQWYHQMKTQLPATQDSLVNLGFSMRIIQNILDWLLGVGRRGPKIDPIDPSTPMAEILGRARHARRRRLSEFPRRSLYILGTLWIQSSPAAIPKT